MSVIEAVALAALLAAGAAWIAAVRARSRARHLEGELDEARSATATLRVRPAPVAAPETPFLELAEAVHEAVLIHGERVLLANSRFAALLALTPEELVGRHLAELVAPDYAELVGDNVRRRLAGQPAAERYEVEVADVHGQVTRLELAGTIVRYRGAPAVLFTAVEMLARQGRTDFARGRAQATIDSLGDGLVTTDSYGRIDFMNASAEQLLGRALDEVSGQSFADVVTVVDEADRRALTDPVRQCLASGVRVSLGRRAVLLTRADGAERSIELTASPLAGERGETAGAVVLLHDVTDLRGIARQMSYQASHDALTGLVNRREFERRLQDSMDLARSGAQTQVLCYLDLDRFKAVNDTSGHTAGDNMLREVAALVKDAVRDSDTVARIGGDEFAMLLVGCPLDKAIQIAEDVSSAIRDYRFVWKDKIFMVGVSIGLVEVGRESASIEDVMSAADSACYVAKSRGQGHVHVYSSRDEARARQRGEIHWLQRLQQALREGRFVLYTQTIVSSPEGATRGPALEVLVRLSGEDGSLIAPGEFLKAAERYRLMSLVDRWVVQTALAALGRGAIRLPPGRSLSLNISGQTLGDAQFLEFVVDCLDRTGVAPAQVCFEVTEASVVGNLDHARRFIGVLHGMGCSFALDDFGSGLGSFANLKTLAMDYLKIDGAYMRDLARDTVNQAMVSAMVKLARTLDFQVIAEQVEDAASLEAARRMGIDFVQGFAISRPEPLQAVA
ncbi:MAG: EAL domain-containing protein [Proteobacteria bacterium]|nr:EAL domain-containing protein [Pseudomonadota bacterium]